MLDVNHNTTITTDCFYWKRSGDERWRVYFNASGNLCNDANKEIAVQELLSSIEEMK